MSDNVRRERGRLVIEAPGSIGDSVEFWDNGNINYRGEPVEHHLGIGIENPYAGDTESGIGRDARIFIHVQDVPALIAFLQELVGAANP